MVNFSISKLILSENSLQAYTIAWGALLSGRGEDNLVFPYGSAYSKKWPAGRQLIRGYM